VSRAKPPKRGDLVRLDFDPQMGHEQSDFRPALVVSNSLYNEHSSTIVVCPITSRQRGWPFEIVLPAGKVEGFVLVDQVRAVDWRARKMRFLGTCSDEFLHEIDVSLDVLLRGASQDA
jgi:mRNA interferase MazF